ncbi:MAG TPA: diacylglycerol kinase family protein [Candidatus Limnocylindria bacterium]|nr:diacylglycerol kinase family protein [Candidatus Limnocylindria bacterium]
MTARYFAVVNPAAGGGRCGELADAALDRVRRVGLQLEIARTSHPGEATELVHAAYAQGFRNFLAVGGDGTTYEIINGLFPKAISGGRPTLGFLPLGTGNSFLKDFTSCGVEHTIEALKKGARRTCDVIRLRHAEGEIYFLNLMSLGFPADVGELVNRRFKGWGELGYILGVFMRLARLQHLAFPHRLDNAAEWDRRRVLFLSFSNSKFTGGKMMIAPKADPTDGSIEYVHWSPIGRLGLLWNFPTLFTGTHIKHPRASRTGAKRIEFKLDAPVNVLVDGEILRLDCRSLEILPAALEVAV